MAFVDHLLSDRAAAEDVTQETFVKIWRSARRFRADAPFEPWLYRIARHEAYDVARRRRRPREAVASPLADAIASSTPPPPDAELAGRLRDAVATLSEALRETFVLVRMLHRPHDEVARLLDVPIGTVKSRLAAAEAALRRRLGDLGDGVGGGRS
jgi:RNA polymerase sigma-70 factor (ECF subfamily)